MSTYGHIIRYAMQAELDGQSNYEKNAEKSNNPTTKKLFSNLAKMEKGHYEYLKNLLDSYEKDEPFDSNDDFLKREEDIFETRQEDEKMDITLQESDIPDITALRVAYLIEKDFKEYYQNSANDIEDEELKKIFERLAKWEEGHEILLKKEYDRRMKEYMNLPWGG